MASASVQRSSLGEARGALLGSSAMLRPAPVSAARCSAAPTSALSGRSWRARFEVRARLGQAAGIERGQARAHFGVELVVGHGALHAREALGGRDVAGIALEHVGEQRLRLGQVLGVLGVFGVGQRGHHAARGRHLAEPLGGFLVAAVRS